MAEAAERDRERAFHKILSGGPRACRRRHQPSSLPIRIEHARPTDAVRRGPRAARSQGARVLAKLSQRPSFGNSRRDGLENVAQTTASTGWEETSRHSREQDRLALGPFYRPLARGGRYVSYCITSVYRDHKRALLATIGPVADTSNRSVLAPTPCPCGVHPARPSRGAAASY